MVNGHANNAVSYVLGPGGEPARGQLFVASMRRGEDGTDGEGHPGFSLESISVPANHRVGAIERASFGGPIRSGTSLCCRIARWRSRSF